MRALLQKAALLVLAWTSPDTAPTEWFLSQESNKHGMSAVPTLHVVLEEYLSSRSVALPLLAAGGAGTPARALELARAFMRKRNLHEWIAQQNETKGLAPTTDLVQRQLLLEDRVYEPLRAPAPALSLSPVSTKWAQRFRRQWRLRRGSYQPQETLAQDVLLHRAPQGLPTSKKSRDGGAKLLRAGANSGCRFSAPMLGPHH